MDEDTPIGDAPPSPFGLFDDRYGIGAYERMVALLRQPCVSFAQVAVEFGVSRERVRQWHARYLPGAPTGLARRRLCQLQHARKRLLSDPLFRAFYKRARASVAADQINLIRTRDGLRLRTARVLGQLLVVKKARRKRGARTNGRAVHVLSSSQRTADFVYYQLDADNFLVIPQRLLPATGTTYVDSTRSKYHAYRNTFAALLGTDAARLAG